MGCGASSSKRYTGDKSSSHVETIPLNQGKGTITHRSVQQARPILKHTSNTETGNSFQYAPIRGEGRQPTGSKLEEKVARQDKKRKETSKEGGDKRRNEDKKRGATRQYEKQQRTEGRGERGNRESSSTCRKGGSPNGSPKHFMNAKEKSNRQDCLLMEMVLASKEDKVEPTLVAAATRQSLQRQGSNLKELPVAEPPRLSSCTSSAGPLRSDEIMTVEDLQRQQSNLAERHRFSSSMSCTGPLRRHEIANAEENETKSPQSPKTPVLRRLGDDDVWNLEETKSDQKKKSEGNTLSTSGPLASDSVGLRSLRTFSATSPLTSADASELYVSTATDRSHRKQQDHAGLGPLLESDALGPMMGDRANEDALESRQRGAQLRKALPGSAQKAWDIEKQIRRSNSNGPQVTYHESNEHIEFPLCHVVASPPQEKQNMEESPLRVACRCNRCVICQRTGLRLKPGEALDQDARDVVWGTTILGFPNLEVEQENKLNSPWAKANEQEEA